MLAKATISKRIEDEAKAKQKKQWQSNKHKIIGDQKAYQNVYHKKRLATFTPDFSLASVSVDKLAKSIDHLERCEKDLHTPNF